MHAPRTSSPPPPVPLPGIGTWICHVHVALAGDVTRVTADELSVQGRSNGIQCLGRFRPGRAQHTSTAICIQDGLPQDGRCQARRCTTPSISIFTLSRRPHHRCHRLCSDNGLLEGSPVRRARLCRGPLPQRRRGCRHRRCMPRLQCHQCSRLAHRPHGRPDAGRCSL